MEAERTGLTPDALLAELGWIRSLAQALIGDHADVDDVVQEAWLAAATHPPRDATLLRPWLRRVVTNLLAFGGRSSARRARRESASAPGVAPPPADELLARAHLQHELASLVLALSEPYRSTVLLRYFDGLSAAEIARRQAVPAATVRWRLAQALAQLRARLDERTGGDRRAWLIALLPSTGRLAWVKGALLMKTTLKLSAFVALLLLLLFLGVRWSGRPAVSPDTRVAARVTAFGRTDVAAVPDSKTTPGWFAQPGVAARRVAGRVLYDERPVDGATVELADALTDVGAIPRQVRRTDAEGRFDFGLQAAAKREVIASAPGRTPVLAAVELRDPLARPASDQLVLRLRDCAAPVGGVVSDASAGAIAGASVCHASGRVPRSCSLTDSDGRYELCIERDGAASLYVGAPGYGAILDRVHPHGARVRRDFALVPQAVVSGTVVRDHDGQPVAGARVSAELTHARGGAGARTLSDDSGRFVLDGITAGHYQIMASSGDLASLQPIDVVLKGGRTRSDLTVRLSETATVRGVVMSGGKPLAGAQLQTASRVLPSSLSPLAISQIDGSFVLRGVARGLNELRSRAHEVESPKVLNVDRAELDGVRVEVTPPAIVSGRVWRKGRPVPNASVVSETFETRTDESGAFQLSGLRAGPHTLFATSPQARATAQVRVRAGDLTHIDLDLGAAASISGVLVEEDGRPATGLVVVFSQARGGDFSMCTSAQDGSFAVTRLAGHDTYVARVQADLSAPAKLSPPPGASFPEVALADGDAHVEGIRLVIHRDHLTIAGTVVDSAGAPRPDVEVAAVRVDKQSAALFNEASPYPRATSVADGSFAIADLDEGSFLLHAQAGDGPEVEVTGVRSGARGVVLRLPASGAIAGRLIGFRTVPAGVIATPVSGAPRVRHATVTGSSFSIGDLTPGEYQVAALSSEAGAVTVTVGGGSTTTATLEARSRATVRGRVLEISSGLPVAGLTCNLLLGGALPDPSLRLPGGVVTDEQGRFVLTAPAGRPVVECWNPAGTTSNGAAVLTTAADQEVDAEIRVVQPRTPRPGIGKLIGVQFSRSLLGARLAAVVPKGPADRAGLRAGDALLAIDGRSVDPLTQDGIILLIYDRPVGDVASLTVARGDQRITAQVKVASPAD